MSDLPAGQPRETDDGPALHPALEAFTGLFQTPQAQAWAEEAAQKVQAFNSVRDIADAASQAGTEYVANIDAFKSGLTRFVHNDPTGLPLALDLVPGAVNAFLPEGHDEHAAPLTGHIQSEIVRAGVQSLAFHDEGAAQQAMDAYGEHLTDEDKSHLGGFIDTMAAARAADHAAQIVETQRQSRVASDALAHDYLGRLTDPGTGDVRFPNNWMRDMMADPRVNPQTKAVLSAAHDRLVAQGDPVYSDPNTVAALLDRALQPGALSPTEVWSHAGADLSLADTQMLAGAAFPKTPEQKREISQFAATLSAARNYLAPPENGLAGQRAFGDFVNWLLPEYRMRGAGSLDEASPNWIFGGEQGAQLLDHFLPSGGDILIANTHIPWVTTADQINGRVGDRPSLSDIFGGGGAGPPAGDRVIETPRPPLRPGMPYAQDPGIGTLANPGFNNSGAPVYANPRRRI